MSDDSRDKLNELSRTLLQVHKALLAFQKAEQENTDRRQLTPQELLQALFANPDFEWLRTLSSLVARIDEVADDKTALHAKAYEEFMSEIRNIFNESDLHGEFKSRLNNALLKDSMVRQQIAALRNKFAL